MSNAPSSARDTAIAIGIAIAEYFRDMGYNVTLLTDSTTRWLRSLTLHHADTFEVKATSKLESFFERAGKLICVGSPHRYGSISIFGTVSCDGSNYADSVCTIALQCVQSAWFLDVKLAQRRHFPSINPLISFSKNSQNLDTFYQDIDSEFPRLRDQIKNIIRTADDLSEIVALIGPASALDTQPYLFLQGSQLEEHDKLCYQYAKFIHNDFLAQNFSESDSFCPFYKTIWMMKNFVLYYELSLEAIQEEQMTWAYVLSKTVDLLYRLTLMKFEVEILLLKC